MNEVIMYKIWFMAFDPFVNRETFKSIHYLSLREALCMARCAEMFSSTPVSIHTMDGKRIATITKRFTVMRRQKFGRIKRDI